MSRKKEIEKPEGSNLDNFASQLRELSGTIEATDATNENWPAKQLELASRHGVNHWFVPRELGGYGWSQREIVSGYLKIAAACLTTTFVITQRAAAIKRIVASENLELRDELIKEILNGESAATVGISHLTTSRRHVGKPVLTATQNEIGFELNGFSPWVTGGMGATHLVVGAELEDGRQILVAIPSELDGVSVDPGFSLVALSGSQTGAVKFNGVQVDRRWMMAGPIENVLTSGPVKPTGGFQTSALAVGLATAAIEFLADQASMRDELSESSEALQQQRFATREKLLQLADGEPVCTNEELRTEANSLVLRATQAALVAAKGTGYVSTHPVGRWCRESLFFLVWSCPQAVANANLCELAGTEF